MRSPKPSNTLSNKGKGRTGVSQKKSQKPKQNHPNPSIPSLTHAHTHKRLPLCGGVSCTNCLAGCGSSFPPGTTRTSASPTATHSPPHLRPLRYTREGKARAKRCCSSVRYASHCGALNSLSTTTSSNSRLEWIRVLRPSAPARITYSMSSESRLPSDGVRSAAQSNNNKTTQIRPE